MRLARPGLFAIGALMLPPPPTTRQLEAAGTSTAYPIKGGTYAGLRCLPLPDIERLNNPNLGG
jgi:hypothetical protein